MQGLGVPSHRGMDPITCEQVEEKPGAGVSGLCLEVTGYVIKTQIAYQ